ncbi:MAG: glutamyl-tRNA reductase [Cyclobacteriaceae bacterium]
MNVPFKAISLSHKRAPLEVREHFAMNANDRQRLLQYAKELGSIEEMLVVSTCNRFEVYFTSSHVDCKQLTELIKLFVMGPNLHNYLEHFQLYDQPAAAVEHLFRVSAGLESQVLGDLQIINQVKKAYQNSVDLDLAGPFLHRLMHTIFHTHKKIAQDSCFKDCHASVSQVTKNLVRQLFPDKHPTALILGAGKIGEDLCRKLSKMGYKVWVSNRTAEKSLALAAELDLKPIHFNEVHQALNRVQLVISALTVGEPFLTKESINSTNWSSHKYFIDLSVPRSIAPALAEDPNITLLNMDDINDEISSTIQKRRNEIPKVESIINTKLKEFLTWAKELKVLPTIHQIKAALEKIRQEELARCLKHTDLKEDDAIKNITKSIVDRVVKLPVLKLKLACKRGEDEKMVQVLNEIFDI